MKTGRHFQALQYTLIIRDATGAKITGTGSVYDLEGTRTFAASVFRVNRRAAFVDIHPYIEGGTYTDTAWRLFIAQAQLWLRSRLLLRGSLSNLQR